MNSNPAVKNPEPKNPEETTQDDWKVIEEMVVEENECRQESLKQEIRSIQKNGQKVEETFYGTPSAKRKSHIKVEENLEQKNYLLKDLRRDSMWRESIANKIKKMGLTPLGVVPEYLFQQICTTAGLYRFESLDEKGRADIKSASGVWIQPLGIFMAAIIAAIVPSILGIAVWGYSFKIIALVALASVFMTTSFSFMIGDEEDRLLSVVTGILGVLSLVLLAIMLGERDVLSIIAEVVASLLLFLLANGVLTSLDAGHLEGNLHDGEGGSLIMYRSATSVLLVAHGLFMLIKDFLPKKILMKCLWPHKVDRFKEKLNRFTPIDVYGCVYVSFPNVTPAFIEKLKKMKAAGLQPMIAAPPQAVRIEGKGPEVESDPILYFNRTDDCVVILHGECPVAPDSVFI